MQVKFTFDELRRIMDRMHNIRNMSVIAHVDHGMLFVLIRGLVSSLLWRLKTKMFSYSVNFWFLISHYVFALVTLYLQYFN